MMNKEFFRTVSEKWHIELGKKRMIFLKYFLLENYVF